MCGRYSLALPPNRLGDRIHDNYGISVDEYFNTDDVRTTHNVAPTYNEPVIRMMKSNVSSVGARQEKKVEKSPQAGADEIPVEDSQEQHHHDKLNKSEQAKEEANHQTRTVIQGMRWGFIPTWEKTWPSMQDTMRRINTRDDSLVSASSKGIWTPSKNRRRCAILAEGYYEWAPPATAAAPAVPPAERQNKPGRLKQPYYIKRKDSKLLFLAGLYDRCDLQDEPDKGPIYSYTIITTAATSDMEFIHDRMPVVLFPDKDPEGFKMWLDPNLTWTDKLSDYLLRNAGYEKEGTMDFYPVDRRVGKVGTDSNMYVVPFDSKENKSNIANYFAKKPTSKKSEPPHKKEADGESTHGSVKKEGGILNPAKEVKQEHAHENTKGKSGYLAYEDDQFEDEPDIKEEDMKMHYGHPNYAEQDNDNDQLEEGSSDDEFYSPPSDTNEADEVYSPEKSEIEAEREEIDEPGEAEPTDEPTIDVGEDVKEQVKASGKRSKHGGNGDTKRKRSPKASSKAETKPKTAGGSRKTSKAVQESKDKHNGNDAKAHSKTTPKRAAKAAKKNAGDEEEKDQANEDEQKSEAPGSRARSGSGSKTTRTKKSNVEQSPETEHKLTTHEKRVEAGRKGAKARLEHRAEEAKLKREEIGEETHKKLSAAGKKGGHLGGLARAGKIPQDEYGDDEDEEHLQQENEKKSASHQSTSASRPGGPKARKGSLDLDSYEEDETSEMQPRLSIYDEQVATGHKGTEIREQHHSEEAKRKQKENSVCTDEEQYSAASNKNISKKRHRPSPHEQHVEVDVELSQDTSGIIFTTEDYEEPSQIEYLQEQVSSKPQKWPELTSFGRNEPLILDYTEPIDDSAYFIEETLIDPQPERHGTRTANGEANNERARAQFVQEEARHRQDEQRDTNSVFSISQALVEPYRHPMHAKYAETHKPVAQHAESRLKAEADELHAHDDESLQKKHESRKPEFKKEEPRMNTRHVYTQQPTNPHELTSHEKHVKAGSKGAQIRGGLLTEQTSKRIKPSQNTINAVTSEKHPVRIQNEQHVSEKPTSRHELASHEKHIDPAPTQHEQHVSEKATTEHKLTSHEKHVQAGKKGAQVRHEHLMEQDSEQKKPSQNAATVVTTKEHVEPARVQHEQYVSEEPMTEHKLTSLEKHVEAGKKDAQVRHEHLMEQQGSEQKKPSQNTATVTTTEEHVSEKPTTEHKSTSHEKHVEAGKKGAQARIGHHQLSSHEKHVQAGIKGAQVRHEHLVKQESEQKKPSQDTTTVTTTEEHVSDKPTTEHKLTSHEKHVQAGKKGAQVRRGHLMEQEHSHMKPSQDTAAVVTTEEHISEKPLTVHRLTSHEKHVRAGKKGAQTRLKHDTEQENELAEPRKDAAIPSTTIELSEQPQDLLWQEEHLEDERRSAQSQVEHHLQETEEHGRTEVSNVTPQPHAHELSLHEKRVEAGKKGAQVRLEHLKQSKQHSPKSVVDKKHITSRNTTIAPPQQDQLQPSTHVKHVEAGKKGAQARLDHQVSSHKNQVKKGDEGAQVRRQSSIQEGAPKHAETTKDVTVHRAELEPSSLETEDKTSTGQTEDMSQESLQRAKETNGAGDQDQEEMSICLTLSATGPKGAITRNGDGLIQIREDSGMIQHESSTHGRQISAEQSRLEYVTDDAGSQSNKSSEDANKVDQARSHSKVTSRQEQYVHSKGSKVEETRAQPHELTPHEKHVLAGRKGAQVRLEHLAQHTVKDPQVVGHEISTHEKRVAAGRKGAQVEAGNLMGQRKVDQADSKHNTANAMKDGQDEKPHELTSHEKHVLAGRKGAQVRLEHLRAKAKGAASGHPTNKERSGKGSQIRHSPSKSNHKDISAAEHDAYSEIGKMGAAARWHKGAEGKISEEIHEKLSEGGRRGGLARRQRK